MSVSRIYRLLRLITLLQQGRSYTANELAEELGVSRRTVFRDLNMLEMAHIPYYFDEQRSGYRINHRFFLPPVNLTLGEALAVLMLTGRLRSTGKLPLMSEGAKAAAKVESVLPAAIQGHVGSVLEKLSFSLGPVSSHQQGDQLFERISTAIGDRLICRIAYHSLADGGKIDLTVHPQHLLFKGRGWYLLAWTREHGQVRTLKLDRIGRLEVTDEVFEEVKPLQVEDHFGLAWNMIPEGTEYDIHLRFESKVARNVAEVQWHRTQQTTFNNDGTLDFRARVDGLGEITWWILGYGDQVEVLAPQQLRESVTGIARNVVRRYEPEGC